MELFTLLVGMTLFLVAIAIAVYFGVRDVLREHFAPVRKTMGKKEEFDAV